MSLSADSLALKIKFNLEGAGFATIAQNEALVQAIARGVIDEMIQNAVVKVEGTSNQGAPVKSTGKVS